MDESLKAAAKRETVEESGVRGKVEVSLRAVSRDTCGAVLAGGWLRCGTCSSRGMASGGAVSLREVLALKCSAANGDG